MIIILHGKDNYRIEKKLKEIISGYKEKNKSGVNLVWLPEKPSFNDLKDESRQVGMFEEKRLLIGKNILTKDLKKEIEKRLDELIDQENILILKENQKIKGKLIKKIKDLSKDKGMIKEYEKLEGKKLKTWYKREISKSEAGVTRSGLRKLVEYIGDDLWRAKNEIDKLTSMKKGDEVTKETVIKYVKPNLETNIFEAIDALANGNKKKATQLFETQFQNGDSPFYLFSMIDYQLRNLLIIGELKEKGLSYKEMKSKSGLSNFVFKKSFSQAKNLPLEKVKKIHQKLFEVDLNSKLGKITPETGLFLIISQF